MSGSTGDLDETVREIVRETVREMVTEGETTPSDAAFFWNAVLLDALLLISAQASKPQSPAA